MIKFLTGSFLLLLAVCAPVRAGGAGSQFVGGAETILKQQPALHAMVTSTFVVQNEGFLGPLEQRLLADGTLGRKYIFHEFKASGRADQRRYVIRIYFNDRLVDPTKEASIYNMQLDRLEIVPTDEAPEAPLRAGGAG